MTEDLLGVLLLTVCTKTLLLFRTQTLKHMLVLPSSYFLLNRAI